MTASAKTNLVFQKYRALGRLINRLPEPTGSSSSSICPDKAWDDLRTAFRKPVASEETLEARLKQADDRASFLRMVTPKSNSSSSSSSSSGGGRWVYRNGRAVQGNAPVRDKNGRVISNWDGKNMDPDSVKQHNYQLKRMGFRNNAHAKGIF